MLRHVCCREDASSAHRARPRTHAARGVLGGGEGDGPLAHQGLSMPEGWGLQRLGFLGTCEQPWGFGAPRTQQAEHRPARPGAGLAHRKPGPRTGGLI